MILFFIILLFSFVNSYTSKEIDKSNLKFFKGDLIYAKKMSDGGTRKHYFYFFKIKGSNIKFKISNLSYDLLDNNDFNKIFLIGNKFEIATTEEELSKANNKSIINTILNKIFDSRGKPNIFNLVVNNISYITIDKYNKKERELAKSNVNWGVPFCLFSIIIFGLVGYANWKTRFENN